jgi:hypothetical protein
MRVTGVIKDYITREVTKKCQEKLNSIPNDYQEDYDKMIDEIQTLVDETNVKARQIAEKYGMLEERNYNIISYSTYRLGDSKRRDQRYALVNELKKERDDKIAQIILDLELGETTKKELNDVLANVNF